MSYLSTPRLVFAGKFQADVSTINNDPEHFDSAHFRSNYELPGEGTTNGWWNPTGSGAWRFYDCTVRSVVYEDGTTCDDPSLDPVVGLPVSGTDGRAPGKLVDLDPDMQMVSEIWGFQVLLGSAAARAQRGGGPGVVFRSEYDVAPFFDLWGRYPQGHPDSFFGAGYQSTLSGVRWGSIQGSRFLAELAAGQPPEQLSIKFNVDGFDDDRSSPTFTLGRVVGAIGRYRPGDPRRIVLGRHLEPIDGAPLNDGVAVLEGRRLTLDLGNSLPTTGPGGPLVDQGRLYAVLDPGEADEQVLGQISYLCQDWYETTAGIAALELSGADARRARSRPLGVFLEGEQGPEFLAESRDGRWLRADQFVFRIGSPGTATAELWATRFGRLPPEPDKTGKPKPWPVTLASVAYNTSGEKVTGLTFPRQVDLVGGRAEVKLSGDLDGEPRHYIDGQVSGVAYGFKNKPPATGTSNMLSVLVWSPYRTPANGPSWLPDVQPIFQQYANLYPVMRPIVDLSSYASVVERLGIMRRIFSKKVKVTDASYMPATRDLSPAKRRMLHAWLDGNPPRYMHTDSKEALYLALQQAVELEHATLPPYLTALYSIMPGRNVEVAELIRSVVLEEMLHMSLACNLLISIGGNPSISHPGFVPRYPGSLPGGLRGGLTVRLRRCSIEQIRDVFLSIEEPEETIEESGGEVQEGDAVEHHAYTIGWFYDQIARALETLSRDGKISFGRTGRQVEPRIGPHRVFRIGSLEDALRVIHEIKEQGEGASPLDPAEQPGREDLAHFYKFSEIVHGRRIVFEKDGFGYTGDEVPFDPDAVYPMMDDPDTQTLAPGSRARILSEQFDQSYQALLNALHATFNGHPERLQQAIGAMYSLEVQASQLMQAPSGRDDGTTAGPSFQLPFPL